MGRIAETVESGLVNKEERNFLKEDVTRNGALLVEGPIGRILFRLTVPMTAGILGMVAFNLTDTYFVGRLGTEQLAALGFTLPVVLVLNRVAIGLGIGASAVISRAVGTGDRARVRRLTTDSLILAAGIAVFLVTLGQLTIDDLFAALGATRSILPLVKQYMAVWYWGLLFVVFPMVSNNAIRAEGDTKTPAMIMLVSVAINVALDPLLIFGVGPFPRLGVPGAALATVIARASTALLSFYIVCFRRRMLTRSRPALQVILNSWKSILYVGIPAAATKVIVPVGIGILTGIVAVFGSKSVAAFSVGTKIEFFAMAVVFALSSVISPFVGQNLGAGKTDRIRKGIKISNRFAVAWGLGMFALLAIPARAIASIFTNDPEVISKTVLYMRIVPLGYCMQGIIVVVTSSLNVIHKPVQAAAISILQVFAFCIPLAFLGRSLFGLPGIYGGITLSYIISGLLAWIVLLRYTGPALERYARH